MPSSDARVDTGGVDGAVESSVATQPSVNHLGSRVSPRYRQIASGIQIPLNNPNGLNGWPGVRAVGGPAGGDGRCRASERRAVNSAPHRAARQQHDFISQRVRRNQPSCESVPELCQLFAALGVLANLARRRNSKLRAVNAGRGTDSVPGHHKHRIILGNYLPGPGYLENGSCFPHHRLENYGGQVL